MFTELNTEAELESFIANPDTTLLYYWAGWSGPCAYMSKVFKEVLKANPASFSLGKVNVDEHNELAENHRVNSIPAMQFYRNGEPVGNPIQGAPKREQLEAMIAQAEKVAK
jgi:thioredoxin 1